RHAPLARRNGEHQRAVARTDERYSPCRRQLPRNGVAPAKLPPSPVPTGTDIEARQSPEAPRPRRMATCQSTASHPCRVVALDRMYHQCTIGNISEAQACCDDRFCSSSIGIHLKIRQVAQMTGEGCAAQLTDSRQP